MKMQTKSGKPIFPIGIGMWDVSSAFEADPLEKYKGTRPVYGSEEVEIDALRYSLSSGQNHIDCAELYGAFYTDEVVGRAIAGLPREDLFIGDKLWKTSIGPGLVRPTVEKMLEKLGTDYIDLLYIHNAWDGWQEAVPQIDELIDEGVVRYFGVSNFTVGQMQEAMALAKHPLAANQVRFNVLHKKEADDEFRTFCRENDAQIVAFQPLKRQAVLENKTVQAIAKAHDASPAQVALAWLVAKGALPIPKAMKKEHINENCAAVNVKLSEQDVRALDEAAA